jgi:hypothetical protein
MVRILPMLEFISERGGLTDIQVACHDESNPHGATGQEFVQYALGRGGWVDYLTIGWLPLALFGLACVCSWRKWLPWAVAVLLFSWLTLGGHAPVDLFGILHRLPVFGTVVTPRKYFSFLLVFSVGLAGGQFFRVLQHPRLGWAEHVCAPVLVVLALSFLYVRTVWIQHETYTARVPRECPSQEEQFYNVQGLHLPRKRVFPTRAVTYFNVRRNIGTIDWRTSVPMEERAIPRYFVTAADSYTSNPEYRGEAFFLEDLVTSASGSGRSATPTFHPNSITVEVAVPEAATLVINQNYHPAWRSDRGELIERDGLLALRLQQTGSYTINLRYRPRSFVVGLVISLVSIAAWTLAFWASARRRARC